MKNELLGEAIKLEEALHREWTADAAERHGRIWLELKRPYAHLFKRQHLGDDVGAGWWEDLLVCFEDISRIIEARPEYVFAIQQIKEKFGEIRFYYVVYAPDEDLNAWPRKEDAGRDELHREIAQAVRRLEEATRQKCEICGQPGERRNSGWIKTLCEQHEEVRRERDAARFSADR